MLLRYRQLAYNRAPQHVARDVRATTNDCLAVRTPPRSVTSHGRCFGRDHISSMDMEGLVPLLVNGHASTISHDMVRAQHTSGVALGEGMIEFGGRCFLLPGIIGESP